jgi:D-alanine transaminase
MTDIVYLNGEFMPLEDARIPVLDRGFIFGDGVYEVIPVYSRHPFRLPEHLCRLQHSLDSIRLANPLTDAEWTRLMREIVSRNAGDDQSVYLQVTRGVARRDHAFPKGVKPTIFMMASPLVTPPVEQVKHGVTAITGNDFRWLRCDVKSVSLLGNCLLRQQAADASAVEILLFRDGYLRPRTISCCLALRTMWYSSSRRRMVFRATFAKSPRQRCARPTRSGLRRRRRKCWPSRNSMASPLDRAFRVLCSGASTSSTRSTSTR